MSNHFNLSKDIRTGFVTIEVIHSSPIIAKKWIDLMVYEVNEYYRELDREKQKSIDYLQQVGKQIHC